MQRTTHTEPVADTPTAAAVAGAPVPDDGIDVKRVGTFAAGQSPEGEHVVAVDAPLGSFATGEAITEEHPDIRS